MNRFLLVIFVAFLALGLNSCLKANKPPSQVNDVNEGNSRIYGEPESPARQSQITYDKLPDEIQQADKIRNILYPS